MNKEDHIQRHKMLHEHLDELIADYVTSSNKLLGDTTVLELMDWSYKQTVDPFERQDEIPGHE